jgi:hypothetical protein
LGSDEPATAAGTLASFMPIDSCIGLDPSQEIPALSIDPGIARTMVKTWRTKPAKNSLWYVAMLERDVVEVGRVGKDEALSAGHTSPARCAIFFLSGCVSHYRTKSGRLT